MVIILRNLVAIILFRTLHNPSLTSVHSNNLRNSKFNFIASRSSAEASRFQYRGFLSGTACL